MLQGSGGLATGLGLDVSFQTATHSGLSSIQLVNRLVRELPLLRPLVLMVKRILRANGLNDSFTGGVSSYGVVLLVASFLERHGAHYHHAPAADLGKALLNCLEYVTRSNDTFTADSAALALRICGCSSGQLAAQQSGAGVWTRSMLHIVDPVPHALAATPTWCAGKPIQQCRQFGFPLQ